MGGNVGGVGGSVVNSPHSLHLQDQDDPLSKGDKRTDVPTDVRTDDRERNMRYRMDVHSAGVDEDEKSKQSRILQVCVCVYIYV